MKKVYKILILLVLCIGSVQAQRDYRKGYIITNQQDTIYGWIDYRGDIRNSKLCSFKKTETEQATEYSPSDIAAYRFIDSKFYVSKNVGTADAPNQVFLEYLVNGMAKLYYFRDERTNNRYYIEKDGRLLELKMDEKEVEVNGKIQIVTVKSYVGILRATLNVWEMNDDFEKAKLEHSSLINIAKDYHRYACTDGSECIIYERKKPLMALRIGPTVGVDISKLKYMDRDVKKYHLDPSTNFSVGVNLNFSIPQFNEKLFFQMQVMYTKYYFFDTFETPQKATDVHIRSHVLQTGLAIKYEYPKGKWRPVFAAGGATIIMPDATIEELTDNLSSQGIRPSVEKKDFSTKFMYGFEIIPGVHYYLSSKRIIFVQMQYLQCYNREDVNYKANVIYSLGLMAGIYF